MSEQININVKRLREALGEAIEDDPSKGVLNACSQLWRAVLYAESMGHETVSVPKDVLFAALPDFAVVDPPHTPPAIGSPVELGDPNPSPSDGDTDIPVSDDDGTSAGTIVTQIEV